VCCTNACLNVFVVCGTIGCEACVLHKCVCVSMVCGTMGCEAYVLHKWVSVCVRGVWHHGL